ncbi:MAG: TIGR02281 family clan AA aspartic protease [Deltaproteobacteria bacterium]|nr:TIGR02281 family clan AA aspartic protease [Deltaproteobacteria bacterium]
MICPTCQTPLRSHFNYCPHCGAVLHAPPPRRHSVTAIWFGLVLLAGAAFIFYRALSPSAPREIAFQIGTNPDQLASANPNAGSPAGQGSDSTTGVRLKLPVGTVTIHDIAGDPITQIPAAIVGRGWVALPAETCLGGYAWQFQNQGGDVLEVFGGIIGDTDAVGIWQLRPESLLVGPHLARWDDSRSLQWISIVSDKKMTAVLPREAVDQRYVTRIVLPDARIEPGVFIQEDRVVGWTFGGSTATGYLWRGLDGEDLVYDISVYDYYRATFENSREEQILLALAQMEAPAADQLRSLAEAFRFRPLGTDTRAFAHLQPAAVIPRMQALIDRLRQNGEAVEAADAFDDRILAAVGDVELAVGVVGATLDGYGFGAAIDLIENVQADPAAFGGTRAPELDETRRRLYQKWLADLIHSGDLQTARLVYGRAESGFARDPHIRLLGVELALALSDWSTAERLLSMQTYPPELTNHLKALRSQIAALKGEEGKIVIRFAPGSEQIPVAAVLSGDVHQSFVVDTGASMVTIPRSTAQKLGLTSNLGAARRRVHTAGGTIEAEAVVLPSIELGGWQLDNVEALVLDLPNQPDMGLLGLNYLRRFHMDLNSERGVLTLAPR